MELDSLRLEHFADRLDEVFTLHAADQALRLELVSARGLRSSDGDPRPPFSIVFRGPAEPIAPQAIYPLEHDALGRLELFLVPIGPDRDGMLYEAVFT